MQTVEVTKISAVSSNILIGLQYKVQAATYLFWSVVLNYTNIINMYI